MKRNLSKLFNEIWEERAHISEISGKPLLPKGHFKWYWQFMHVLGKQAFPSFAERKENIMLGLPEEHEKQETYDVFMKRKEDLKEMYFKERNSR